MARWEYKIIPNRDTSAGTVEQALNELGAEGWQLRLPSTHPGWLIMERQLDRPDLHTLRDAGYDWPHAQDQTAYDHSQGRHDHEPGQ